MSTWGTLIFLLPSLESIPFHFLLQLLLINQSEPDIKSEKSGLGRDQAFRLFRRQPLPHVHVFDLLDDVSLLFGPTRQVILLQVLPGLLILAIGRFHFKVNSNC